MRIVIVEDNKSLASGIAHRLRDRGHAIDVLYDGLAGYEFLAGESADMAILDINLPGISGLEIVRRIRKHDESMPILLLTGRANTTDRVAGLDAGADDYLVKPFEMDELEARVRALLRRRGLVRAAVQSIGELEFEFGSRTLRSSQRIIKLQRRELAAFECLLERRGRLVAKSVLINQIYGVGADVDDRVVEVPISRLRKKLGDHGITIKVARGLGYLMDDALS